MAGPRLFRFSGTSRLAASAGFTLLELVLAVILLGMLGAIGVSMISDTLTTTGIINSSQSNVAQARYALERLEREIREVKYTGSAYSISPGFTATKMVFVKTVDGADITVTICNGSLPDCTGTGASASTLTLGYSSLASPSPLSNQVSSFALTYWRIDPVNGIVSTGVDTGNMRFVDVALTVTDTVGGQSIAQRTRIALRNAG